MSSARFAHPCFMLFGLCLALATSASAFAQRVNLEPGLWEYTNTLILTEGSEPQTQVFESCVTQADLDEGTFMLQDIEGCEMLEQSLSENQMTYVMNCQGPEGTGIRIEADITFNGNTAQGVINNIVATPMGDMVMEVTLSARRIGPCEAGEDSP